MEETELLKIRKESKDKLKNFLDTDNQKRIVIFEKIKLLLEDFQEVYGK